MSNEIATLATNFKFRDFNYEQVVREGNVAVFKVTPSYVNGTNKSFYEVIRVLEQKASVRFGKSYGAKEMYPSDEQFGKNAWTARDIDSAMKKFNDVMTNNLVRGAKKV